MGKAAEDALSGMIGELLVSVLSLLGDTLDGPELLQPSRGNTDLG